MFVVSERGGSEAENGVSRAYLQMVPYNTVIMSVRKPCDNKVAYKHTRCPLVHYYLGF